MEQANRVPNQTSFPPTSGGGIIDPTSQIINALSGI
jgi:hypothetical protein